MHHSRYRNRAEAGRELAAAVAEAVGHEGAPDRLVVLGLARGGVPVAAEVAHRLGAPLEVAVVRKLGTPGHEELALGAITGDQLIVNRSLMRSLGVTQRDLDAVVARERRELARRESAYRGGREAVPVAGRTVILVDDGVATGASMRAVAQDVRARGAERVIIAVPTAPDTVAGEFADVADDVVCPFTPRPFVAVGMSYDDFSQTTDEQVREALA
jgi:putative phosphoribosyl transferase